MTEHAPADAPPLTAREAGRLIGVHRDTVKGISPSELPYFTTPGGHRRYVRGDVEAYIARRREA